MVLFGKDGTQWSIQQPSNIGRTSGQNVFTALVGVKKWKLQTPYDAWKLFINEKMLRKIVRHTNEEEELEKVLMLISLHQYVIYSMSLSITVKLHIFQIILLQ